MYRVLPSQQHHSNFKSEKHQLPSPACISPSTVAVETFAHRIVCAVQRECGVTETLRVAPLFETLDDLHNSEASMEGLLSNEWYHAHIGGRQECMIGYSDSGKDAGRLAAAWGLYDVQVVHLTRAPCTPLCCLPGGPHSHSFCCRQY